MTATTIEVDRSIRDRLAILARDRGTTLGTLLAEVAERLERETFLAKARKQLDRLREDDPAAWEADRAESRSWQSDTGRDTLSNEDEHGWWE